MRTSKELTNMFFSDLKKYNGTNFKSIAKADLTKQDAAVHKAFSSVLTRYFIFKEKHPEVTDMEQRMLYFKLKLDMIATYFSEYPETTTDNLIAFQLELKKYVKEMRSNNRSEGEFTDESNPSLSNIELESDNTVSVEQQPELVSVNS